MGHKARWRSSMGWKMAGLKEGSRCPWRELSEGPCPETSTMQTPFSQFLWEKLVAAVGVT